MSHNQTGDNEDASKLSIVEDDWGQLKADVGKCEPPAALLPLLECIECMRKYHMKFNVHDNMMTALSSTENKVYWGK
jgi:hypothetical protein